MDKMNEWTLYLNVQPAVTHDAIRLSQCTLFFWHLSHIFFCANIINNYTHDKKLHYRASASARNITSGDWGGR